MTHTGQGFFFFFKENNLPSTPRSAKLKWQEGKEAGRRRQSLDLDGARVYKYEFVLSQVPFLNFFPALEPHPLSRKHHLGPLAPPDSRLHAGKPARRARLGGLRLSAEPSGRRAAGRPAPRLERRVVWSLKRALLTRRAALRPRVPADGTPHPPTP